MKSILLTMFLLSTPQFAFAEESDLYQKMLACYQSLLASDTNYFGPQPYAYKDGLLYSFSNEGMRVMPVDPSGFSKQSEHEVIHFKLDNITSLFVWNTGNVGSREMDSTIEGIEIASSQFQPVSSSSIELGLQALETLLEKGIDRDKMIQSMLTRSKLDLSDNQKVAFVANLEIAQSCFGINDSLDRAVVTPLIVNDKNNWERAKY